MAALILFECNLQHLKSELRKALPHVGSSHLSESMACGFGYATNIALKADLKKAGSDWTRVVHFDSQQFSERLTKLTGGSANDESMIAECFVQSEYPVPMWHEFRNPRWDSSNENYSSAKSRGLPMVYIYRRRKYSELSWDYITMDSRFDSAVMPKDDGHANMRALFAKFQKFARSKEGNRKAVFDGGATVGSVKMLEPETARELATAYFDFFAKIVRRSSEFKPPSKQSAQTIVSPD